MRKPKTLQANVLHRLTLRAAKLNYPVQHRHFDHRGLHVGARGREEIQQPSFPIQVPFVGSIQFLKDVLNKEVLVCGKF